MIRLPVQASLPANVMNFRRLFLLLTFTLLCSRLGAQLVQIPLSSVSLALPNAPTTTLWVGAAPRSVLVTPFTISGLPYSTSLTWFCLDPMQTIYYSGNKPSGGDAFLTYTNTGAFPTGFDSWPSNLPAPLPQTRLLQLESLFNQFLLLPTPNLAAIQVAVWEIMNETNGYLNPASGTFRISNTTLANQAQSMLSNLNYTLSNTRDPMFLIDGQYDKNGAGPNGIVYVQDLVGFVPVPEASHFALGGVAVLGLIVSARRRRSMRTA